MTWWVSSPCSRRSRAWSPPSPLTDVHAFRLRKVDFDEALRTRPEIAAGVIAELVRRLRTRHPAPVRNRVRLLAAQAGLLGLSVTFLIVPASALFLDRYGADELPFVYLAVAVLGVVVSRVIRAMQARLPLVAVATWCIGAFVVHRGGQLGPAPLRSPDWVSAVLVGLFPLAIPVGFVLDRDAGRAAAGRPHHEAVLRSHRGRLLPRLRRRWARDDGPDRAAGWAGRPAAGRRRRRRRLPVDGDRHGSAVPGRAGRATADRSHRGRTASTGGEAALGRARGCS